MLYYTFWVLKYCFFYLNNLQLLYVDSVCQLITSATADGTLYTQDWDAKPLFPLPDMDGLSNTYDHTAYLCIVIMCCIIMLSYSLWILLRLEYHHRMYCHII